MWETFGAALALMLVFEGMMPFLNPSAWREAILTAADMDDQTLRLVGFISMMLGVILLYLIH